MVEIEEELAPKAIGPYSQGVISGNFVYVSGQLPINAKTGIIESNDVILQTRQSLENVKSILENSGSDMSKVVKTVIYLDDIEDFSNVNQEYAKFFKKPFPARACFQVAKLPKSAKVEIEAIAEL